MTKLFTYQIFGEYTTDLSLIGVRQTIKNKTFSWVLADCGQHLKLTRSKTAICHHCLQSRHIQVMENRGLVVIDRSDAKHYKVIQPCGHEKVIEGNMISYSSYCSECKDQKILSKCPDGTLITGFSELNKYVHLKLPCGHSTKRKAYADDNISCLECRLINKANLLSSISAIEVEYSRYKLVCGHTTGAVAWQGLDTYKCSHCERNAIWDRAKTFGLTATGAYNSERKTHEFMLPCGHTKNLRTTDIKASVVCSVCAEDHYNKPCDMYMLIGFCEDNFRFVKVGVANDTYARLKMYQAKGYMHGRYLHLWVLIQNDRLLRLRRSSTN